MTQDGHIVLLATHPIRLRWLADHLGHLADFLRRSLEGGLQLNAENDQLYFDGSITSRHIANPTRHQEGRAVHRRPGTGLHEEYSRVTGPADHIPEWLSGIDSASIDEIVSTIRSFVGAFPHKASGLSVLVVTSHPLVATRSLRRLVDRLRRRELTDLELELHVVTRSADHDAVAGAMASLDSDEGRGRSLCYRP